MSVKNISSAILGVGVDDTTIDLFESQYPVPTGVSYNSYVIRDEKIAILDTVDDRATDEWLANQLYRMLLWLICSFIFALKNFCFATNSSSVH